MLFDSFLFGVVILMLMVYIAFRGYDPKAKPQIAEPLPQEPYYSMLDSFVHDMNYAIDRDDRVPRELFSWIENTT